MLVYLLTLFHSLFVADACMKPNRVEHRNGTND